MSTPEPAPPSSQPHNLAPEPGELPRRRGPVAWLREYFLGEDPTLGVALVPMCFLSMALFTRHPFRTNFIFDEQEALLANPYVRAVADPNGKIGWLEAFTRDFWGLTSDRTIGSYRPIPNLVWRGLWALGAREQSPFLHHWVNVLLHGLNGALLTIFVLKVTKNRSTAWLAGTLFVASAVVTEAVSGVVGIADVLGGLGAILALLSLRLRWYLMVPAVFASTMFGLWSKESALCIVPLIPFAALACAPQLHPGRPMGWLRAGLAAVGAALAFVLYVELRRRWFPITTPTELTAEANAGKGFFKESFAALLRWYAQPGLPRDPLNNPLIDAPPILRIAGALRVYLRGLGQVLFPFTLSGDYSAPQEPTPNGPVSPESVLGALAFVGPVVAAPVLVGLAWWRRRAYALAAGQLVVDPRRAMTRLLPARLTDYRPVVALGLLWTVLSFFPVSNIPVVLPTVRAERFWYFPIIGTSIVLAVACHRLFGFAQRSRTLYRVTIGAFVLFLAFQCFAARRHANHYTDDLVFWEATRDSVPRSAKAHLNYSVMLGARGRLEERRVSNEVALQLAPKWPMASVYLGDTLCRLHRAPEAIPHYLRGFDLGPNDQNLIALGVGCLWDEKMLAADSPHRQALQALGDKHPGSWLKYIVDDTLANGDKYNGVNPKYRPRGYNEGPKKDE